MPTSTNVTNLKINELTEAQYDTAVQGGVIGANELSVITDLDESIQVDTMPTASATELDKIYQYIGTTDANYTHGYFYECASDGGNPATYSWSNVQVQASSGGLPSQTGQSGKFLTTDGTDASWSDKPLVNNATGTYSLTILGTPSTATNATNICEGSSATGVSSLSVGRNSSASGAFSMAFGTGATASGIRAIQLGTGSNSDANTFKVSNSNGNFEMMSADGTIPAARHAALPAADGTYTLQLVIADGVPTLSWVAV